MHKWWLAFKHGSVPIIYALDSRNCWGSLSRKLSETFLASASSSSQAEERTIVAEIFFGSFVTNREHCMVEFANRAYPNRRLLRPAKEQDSRWSRLPQWQTRTLFTPALSLCPLKADPWQLHFCRPSRKQNSTIIEGWHPPFVINMQRYATHNSNWKCHTGTALPCWGAIFAGLKGYNQPLLPRGICKTGMFGTTPLNSSSLVHSLPEEPQGLAEAATCLTEHKCR